MNLTIFPNIFINNRNIKNSNHNGLNYSSSPIQSYPSLKPLAQDTVSFGNKKIITAAKNTVVDVSKKKVSDFWDPESANFDDIIKLCGSFKEPLKKFVWDLRQALKPYVSTEANPYNAIVAGKKGIYGRVKSPYSAAIKANDRKLFDIEQIKTMGDVGAARIVLRTGDQSETAKVFLGLREMLKKGYKVLEIENYRISPKESYVSQKTLNSFEAFCKKYNQYVPINSRSLENNYTAIHISFELPDGKIIELQIMGKDVEHVKEVEDFFYKYRCNKKFDEKYAPIQEIFDRLMPKLDAFQQETLARYIKDSYANAKQIPPKAPKQKTNTVKSFLPFPYSLPQELSFENLYREMIKCNKASKPKQ